MSRIKELKEHAGIAETTLAGVEDSQCTYEVFRDAGQHPVLILRTTTNDTIHITPEIGKQLVNLIVEKLL